jgi:hypothetical protein
MPLWILPADLPPGILEPVAGRNPIADGIGTMGQHSDQRVSVTAKPLRAAPAEAAFLVSFRTSGRIPDIFRAKVLDPSRSRDLNITSARK